MRGRITVEGIKSNQGIILGVEYDFKNLPWIMPRVKMARLVRQLEENM